MDEYQDVLALKIRLSKRLPYIEGDCSSQIKEEKGKEKGATPVR